MKGRAEAYNSQANGYDSFITKLVPDYPVFNALIAKVIAVPATALDIGCGTGNTTISVLKEHPSAKLTCVDASPAMLEIARSKISTDVKFIESAIEDFQPSAKFDAVISVLVMHNLQTRAERHAVYEKIYSALNKGGVYASVDITKGECERSQDLFFTLWREFLLNGLPKDEVDGKWLPMHEEKDRPIKLSDQAAILNEIGFRSMDIVHKKLNFALTVAFK